MQLADDGLDVVAAFAVGVVPAVSLGSHGDDPPRRRTPQWKDEQRAARRYESVQGVRFQPVDVKIGEQERGRVPLADELDSFRLPYEAGQAVAAGEVAGPDFLQVPARVSQPAGDFAVGLLVGDQLDAPLDRYALRGQMIPEHGLGFCLGDEQQERKPRVGDADVEQLRLRGPATGVDAQLRRWISTLDQLVGQAERLQQFEGARLDGQRPGLCHPVRQSVDNANGHAPAEKGRAQGQASWARSDDEDVARCHDTQPRIAVPLDARQRFRWNESTGRGSVSRYLELWRHTDNDADQLTDEGIDAALMIGARLTGEYAVARIDRSPTRNADVGLHDHGRATAPTQRRAG